MDLGIDFVMISFSIFLLLELRLILMYVFDISPLISFVLAFLFFSYLMLFIQNFRSFFSGLYFNLILFLILILILCIFPSF